METLHDPLMLSRIQFAVTTMFHILWPLLTVGLSAMLLLMEMLRVKSQDKACYLSDPVKPAGHQSGREVDACFPNPWVPRRWRHAQVGAAFPLGPVIPQQRI